MADNKTVRVVDLFTNAADLNRSRVMSAAESSRFHLFWLVPTGGSNIAIQGTRARIISSNAFVETKKYSRRFRATWCAERV